MKRKFSDTWISILIETFIIMLIADFIAGILFSSLFEQQDSSDPYISITINYLIGQVLTIIVFLLFMLSKKNKFMFKKFTLKDNKIILGLIIGFVLNSLCVLSAYLSKSLTLTFNYIDILLIIFAFICVAIQSASEEIICRVFILEKLLKNYESPLIAILGNSIFFGLIHIFNPGISVLSIISIIITGIFFSLLVYYYKSIWIAIGVHTAWNFAQNMVYGLPNSGLSSVYSMFKIVNSSNGFAYNTIFGVEGTYFEIILQIIAILILYLYKRNSLNKVSQNEENTNVSEISKN